jgi:hypothetical protein
MKHKQTAESVYLDAKKQNKTKMFMMPSVY